MTDESDAVPADLRAFAEVVADVLAERGLVIASPAAQAARVLNAAQVAEILRRDRHWVYAHAAELGAFRFGAGPKARVGFDLARVEQWKRERRRTASTRSSKPKGSRPPPSRSPGE